MAASLHETLTITKKPEIIVACVKINACTCQKSIDILYEEMKFRTIKNNDGTLNFFSGRNV